MAEESKQYNTLPFSEAKQDALLGHMLKDDKFFVRAAGRIDPSWFVNVYAKKVFEAKKEFFTRYGRVPTKQELENGEHFMREDQRTRNQMLARVTKCVSDTQFIGLDTITPELTDWLHARIYHEMVDKSTTAFNKQKFQSAYGIMREKLREIDQTSFSNDNEISFAPDEMEARLDQEILDRKEALTFGLRAMDKLLVPQLVENGKEIETGGLLKGDTTIMLAATNVGKTTSLLTIATHNILPPYNKDVLIITHEDTDDEMRWKMLCTVLNWSRGKLFAEYKTEKGRAAIALAAKFISERITFVHMARAGLTVEEVGEVIRRKQDERSSRPNAQGIYKGYDLLVDDYPAKLTTQLAKGGMYEKRHSDEHVYNYFVMLAAEYKFHALLAIQTNREGAKINQKVKGYEHRLIIPQDVAESWGAMCIADNVISINRDEIAEAGEYLTYYIGKSRSNRKGWAVLAKTDYANSLAHDNRLGCTWYPGKSTMAAKVDALLSQYGKPGAEQAVPMHELAAAIGT